MPTQRHASVGHRHRRSAHRGGGRARLGAHAGPELVDFPGEACARCEKPASLCVCGEIAPIDNRVALLILQHPQEQDKVLGSARLATVQFGKSTLRVGLSWASLAKALGKAGGEGGVDPRRWAVLHLGSVRPETLPLPDRARGRELLALDAKSQPLDDQDAALKGIDGVILFDGTWSQAKTLWWRNPWVLKARRLVLLPRQPSLYGRLRKEPRGEGLSTLEAAALVLARLEKRPEIEAAAVAGFELMLAKYRDASRGLAVRADIEPDVAVEPPSR